MWKQKHTFAGMPVEVTQSLVWKIVYGQRPRINQYWYNKGYARGHNHGMGDNARVQHERSYKAGWVACEHAREKALRQNQRHWPIPSGRGWVTDVVKDGQKVSVRLRELPPWPDACDGPGIVAGDLYTLSVEHHPDYLRVMKSRGQHLGHGYRWVATG